MLQVPPLQKWGNYRINVTGSGSIKFHNSAQVYTKHDTTFGIFIQTDKAIYKPGDIGISSSEFEECHMVNLFNFLYTKILFYLQQVCKHISRECKNNEKETLK